MNTLQCFEAFDFVDANDYIEIESYVDSVIVNDNRVLENMLNVEREVTIKDYCSNKESNLSPHMRKIVTDWMLEVCEDQQCKPEVFFLSINYLDRFLSRVNIKKNQFQLCASVCILLASKLLGTSVSVTFLMEYTDNCYTKEEILQWEVFILSMLDWNINTSTCLTIVRKFLREFGLQTLEEETSDILGLLHRNLDFAMMEHKKLAATGLALAAMNREYEDTEELIKKLCKLSDITECELKQIIEEAGEIIEKIFATRKDFIVLTRSVQVHDDIRQEKMLSPNLHNFPEIIC